MNEFSPRFIHPLTSVQLIENTKVGQGIATFTALDDDKSNATIFYYLVGPWLDCFAINKHNGKLTSLLAFDYENDQMRKMDLSILAMEENTEMKKNTVIPFTVEILGNVSFF